MPVAFTQEDFLVHSNVFLKEKIFTTSFIKSKPLEPILVCPIITPIIQKFTSQFDPATAASIFSVRLVSGCLLLLAWNKRT